MEGSDHHSLTGEDSVRRSRAYTTGEAFRTALEERLTKIAREEGIDLPVTEARTKSRQRWNRRVGIGRVPSEHSPLSAGYLPT